MTMPPAPPATIQIHIQLFAGHREIVGQSLLIRTLAAGTTGRDLWNDLQATWPALSRYTSHVRLAVNQQFCNFETELHNGDEVAFIPPVSGGGPDARNNPGTQTTHDVSPFVITHRELELEMLMHWVQTPSDGAVVAFAGVVRDNSAGRATAYLTYEAYPEMARAVLRQLADEARTRWNIGRVAVHHRIGQLEVGATAVLVVVAAPHRQEAFAAAAYIMDRIKEDVPIWKCEHWTDGTHEWQMG